MHSFLHSKFHFHLVVIRIDHNNGIDIFVQEAML